MRIILVFLTLSTCLFFLHGTTSCTKDRLVNTDPDPNDTSAVEIVEGVLKVNEFVAKGSVNQNEFGTAEDWYEIYNPNNKPITLKANEWYFSDNLTNLTKYQLTQDFTIPANGFLVIWCDGLNMIGNDIHTGFSLSAAGEDLVVYYEKGSTQIIIDSYTYGLQSLDGVSSGRYPDGGPNWMQLPSTTPGASNN